MHPEPAGPVGLLGGEEDGLALGDALGLWLGFALGDEDGLGPLPLPVIWSITPAP